MTKPFEATIVEDICLGNGPSNSRAGQGINNTRPSENPKVGQLLIIETNVWAFVGPMRNAKQSESIKRELCGWPNSGQPTEKSTRWHIPRVK